MYASPPNLITVCQSAHAAHYSQNIVVNSETLDVNILASLHRVGGEGELQGGVINAGHVAGSGRLMLFGEEGERVDVDAHGRHVGVVLVRFYYDLRRFAKANKRSKKHQGELELLLVKIL